MSPTILVGYSIQSPVMPIEASGNNSDVTEEILSTPDLPATFPFIDFTEIDIEYRDEPEETDYGDWSSEATNGIDNGQIIDSEQGRSLRSTLGARILALRSWPRRLLDIEHQSSMQVEIVVKPATVVSTMQLTSCVFKYVSSALLLVLILSVAHWTLASQYRLDPRLVTCFYAAEIILFSSILVMGTILCCLLVARGFHVEFKCLPPPSLTPTSVDVINDQEISDGLQNPVAMTRSGDVDSSPPDYNYDQMQATMRPMITDKPPPYDEALLLPRPTVTDGRVSLSADTVRNYGTEPPTTTQSVVSAINQSQSAIKCIAS